MEPYIGEIKMFAGDFAPRGWALCDGSLLQISQWQALFSIIQTYYGGDGMSNFALPDLRGRAPIQQGQGKDLSAYNLGQAIGKESVVLSTDQMPAHTHLIKANSTGANQVLPTNFYPSALIDSVSGESKNLYSDVAPDVTLNPGSVSTVGGATAVNLVQPVLAINFIIALEGIYPSRP
ncbi:tail fiber protein [Mucilaginibacter sp.]|jgi:microcystin-dependent protein|uniref:phage tail protein n=1 Tax=Mucilaginibacter sp. TaxID=1882438 RepID=UPI0025E55D93|nr:tail fiber protein [Mucilaginibacter sp.]